MRRPLPKTNAVNPNKDQRAKLPESVPLQFEPSDQLKGDGMDARNARKDVGNEIRDMICADEMAKSGLQTFYEEIDLRYLGRDSEDIEAPWEGAPRFNLQTMRNKTDQATAYAILPHVKSWPYFLLRAGGPDGDNAPSVEHWISYFLAKAKYGLKISQATNFVFRRGSCPVKVEYIQSNETTKAKPYIKLTPVDLQYFRMYPNSAETFEEAVLVGDVIQVSVDYVRRRQEDGRYFSDCPIGAGQTRLHVSANSAKDKQTPVSNAVYAKDDMVDIFVGLMARDWDDTGEFTWHCVEVAIDEGAILYERKFDSQAFPYADVFAHKELGRNYNESCMCGLLLDSHDWINYISDSMGWLQMYATMPPYAGAGMGLEDEVVETKPGRLLGMEEGAQVFKLGGDVNLGSFPMQLQMAKQTSDETSRVSQNGLAANMKADTSATEVAAISAGQATGIEAYQFLGLCYGMSEIAYAVQHLLAEHFDDWYPAYQDSGPEVEQGDFEDEFYIEVNGQTPINTPAAIAAQATQLLQAWTAAAQVQPDLPQRFPDFVPELIRALTESMTLSNKSKIMPSRDKQARLDAERKAQEERLVETFGQLSQALGAGEGGGPADNGMGEGAGGIQGSPNGVPGIDNAIPGAQPTVPESQS